MLILLSPAKSLTLSGPKPSNGATQPRLLEEATELIGVLREKPMEELASLMSISDELAALNAERYAEFHTPFTGRNARPAIATFAGDVYLGMDAPNRFNSRDYTEAQKTVRILSGLYGVLRPLDLMQPYRLEMGTRLRTDRGADLYQWWGETITNVLRDDLADSPGEPIVVNLASDEYFKAVDPKALGCRVISPRFEDTSEQGKRGIVSFYAKRARGEMAGWLVRNRVRKPKEITKFAEAGYRLDAAASRPDRPVFVRSFEDRPSPATG